MEFIRSDTIKNLATLGAVSRQLLDPDNFVSLILELIWAFLFFVLLILGILYSCIEKFSKKQLDPKIMKRFAIFYISLFLIDLLLLIISGCV